MLSSTLVRAGVRTAALASGVVAIALWPQPAIDYGWTFRLWLVCVCAYGLSFSGAERVFPAAHRVVLAALALILLLAALLRFPAITEIPGNIAIDEVYPGLDAMHIARGEAPNVFSSLGWFNIPRLSFAYPALFIKALGGNAFYGLRLSSAIMGLAGILVTYFFGRRLLGDTAALIAAFLMAAGFWHIHNSRTGFPFIQGSFAVPLVLYLVLRARQDRSLRVMALAGLALGTMLQGYFPVRALLLLAPLLLVGTWVASRESLRRVAVEALVFAGGAALAIGPLLRSVSVVSLTERSYSVLVFQGGVLEWLQQQHNTAGIPAVLWENVKASSGMFIDWADVCILNRSPSGLLDGVTLGAAMLGALVALMHARGRAAFLVLWATIVFVFGVALTDAPRASYRLGPAMPAFYLLAGYGLYGAFFATSSPRRWLRVLVWPVVILAFATWITWTNYRLFFVQYAAEGDGREFLLPGALRLVGDECDGRMFYWLSGEQARQYDLFALFCPDFLAIDEKDIPAVIDRNRRATFIVMRPWPQALARLEACYPRTRPVVHRSSDRRFLFMRVDATAADLAAASPGCAEAVLSESKGDAALLRRPRPGQRPPVAIHER